MKPSRFLRYTAIAAVVVVLLVGALLGFGYYGLPPLVKYVLTHQVSEKLKRPIRIGMVESDPWHLKFRFTGFELLEPDGKSTTMAFDELFVHLDWASLTRRAILVREVRLAKPRVSLVRLDAKRYNVSDLIALMSSDKPSQGPPPKFSVNNIQLTGGRVDFDDRPVKARHVVDAVGLTVPFISSLPYDVDIFVKPAFSARIDGEPLELRGQSKPFKDSLETSVDLKLDGLSLPKYLAYVPTALPVAIDSADLSTQMHVVFTRHDKRDPTLKLSGEVDVRNVAVHDPANVDAAAFAKLDRVHVPIASVDVFERQIALGDIVVEGPMLRVTREKSGAIDLARLAGNKSSPTPAPSTTDTPPGPPPHPLALELASLKFAHGKVVFADAVPSPAVDHEIADLDLSIGRFVLGGPDPVKVDLGATIGAGETVAWHGGVRPQPLAVDGDVEARGIHAARYAPYYSASVPYALEIGPIDASAHVNVADEGKSIRIDRARVATPTLVVRDRNAELAQVDGLVVDGVEFAGLEVPVKVAELAWQKARGLGTVRLGKTALRGAEIAAEKQHIELAGASVGAIQVGETARIEAFAIAGLRVNVPQRRVSLESLTTSGGHLALVRDAKGDLGLNRLVRMPATTAAAKPAGPSAHPAAPWKVSLAKLALSRYDVRFEDRALPKPATQTVSAIQLSARNVSNERGARMDTDLQFVLNQQGRVHIGGKTGLEPFVGNWDVDVREVAVVPFEEYFESHLGIDITSGEVSVKGKLAVGGDSREGLPVHFEGDAGVDHFASQERASGERFLEWTSLAVTGINVNRSPMSIDIAQIALNEAYSRLILYPNGQLNLKNVLASNAPAAAAVAAPEGVAAEGAEGTTADSASADSATPGKAPGSATVAAPTPSPAATPTSTPAPKPVPSATGASARSVTSAATPTAAAAASAPGGPAVPIKIARFSLQGCRVNFSDFFVKPNYKANLTDLAGSVSGLSSDPGSNADVDIRGRIDNSAPLQIAGKVNPLAKDPTLDVRADVKDFELGSLTPYSGKYLGYAIERGTLTFAVRYRVENRKLTATNKLTLNQLTFGDRIASPTATKLPVLLAISLLKDSNGVIDIDLPIGGTLDDPKFSVGGLIWRAILNLIGRAITSPFAMIGAAFGHGEDKLSYVDFAAGRATLDSAALDKLGALAKALASRPALKLRITGQAGPESDREGYKRFVLEQKMRARRAELDARRKGGPPAADAPIDPAEISALMKAVYRKETFAKPKNFLGLEKDIPREEMERLILSNIPAGEDEMRNLAQERAEAVRSYLVDRAGVAADRVKVGEAPTADATKDAKEAKDAKAPRNRVTFALE